MNRSLCSLLGIGVLAGVAGLLVAQESPQPPKLLLIIREDIKEGKGGAHEKSEAQFMRAAAEAKFPVNILGLQSITGTQQAWFIEPYDSFESIAKSRAAMAKPELGTLDALDAEYRSGSRSWIAKYRPDLSFHGQQLMQTLPMMRYFNVITMRIRPEHDEDFAEVAKMAAAAAERSKNDQPAATYQIVSGAPSGTYLLFEPTASLKSLDAEPQRLQALFEAMGEGGKKRFLKLAGESIAFEEPQLFAIDPKMSYVSRQISSADPAFWIPKREEPSQSAPDKPAAKRAKKTTARN